MGMDRDIQDELTGNETVDWLLEPSNPSVRYLTLKELLGLPESDGQVMTAKSNIMTNGPVAEILAQQETEGFWGKPEEFYTDKYKGTVWQLLILAALEADGADERIRKACEFILVNSQDRESGGFSYKGTANNGGWHSGVIPCLTGNLVWALVKFGQAGDPRVQQAISWITTFQRFDDSDTEPPKVWPYTRYEMCWGRHSCHMGVAKTFKALAQIPAEDRSIAVKETLGEAAEFLLKHHIFKKSHDLSRVSRPGWLKPGFPLMYQTDNLEILLILTQSGYKDPRMQEAVDVLVSKRNRFGKWLMENSFNGRMRKNIEVKGKESKWITLNALRVIRANTL